MSDFSDKKLSSQVNEIGHVLFSRPFLYLLCLLFYGMLAGCSQSQPLLKQPAPKAANITVDAATAGTITGMVSFTGAAPKMKPLDMTQDPGCPTSTTAG